MRLFELERLHKVRDRLFPTTHGFGRADELNEVIPFRSFDHGGAQTIVCIVMLSAAAGSHLSGISPRDVDAGYLQTIDRAGFGFGLVLRSAAARLFHLGNPAID